MKILIACLALLALTLTGTPPALAQHTSENGTVKIDPGRLLVRPKAKKSAPNLLTDPTGWVAYYQRAFYTAMARALKAIKGADPFYATLTLMLLSFIYGVLHAAGPGHGKAVVSAWLVANEQQLRRGIVIAAMAAFIQALTAIVLVSVALAVFAGAGSMARKATQTLESASYALIVLVGLYMIWTTIKARLAARPQASQHDHVHHHHDHSQNHDHLHGADHLHDENCGCGHDHMPDLSQLDNDWSFKKALSLAFAIGIRPCSGGILVLLLASSVGLYWAGVAATFAMAIGTGLTVSFVAFLAVTSRNTALKLTGDDKPWLPAALFSVKIAAGLFIIATGSLLFYASMLSPITM